MTGTGRRTRAAGDYSLAGNLYLDAGCCRGYLFTRMVARIYRGRFRSDCHATPNQITLSYSRGGTVLWFRGAHL